MAQEIGSYENNIIYADGPFVISNAMYNGWRIECELKGHNTSVLPDSSIYKLVAKKWGFVGKTWDKKMIADIVDTLNLMVLDGLIVLDGCWWVAMI